MAYKLLLWLSAIQPGEGKPVESLADRETLMGPIRGIILDVDGTLVDSNDAHANAWIEALAEQGITVPFQRVRKLIGMGGDKLLPRVAGIAADSSQGKTITQRRAEIFKKRYLPSIRAFPGARELLQHMRDHRLKLAVASSAKKDELNALLQICGADRVIDAQTSSDDADRSKPDPDIVGAALTEAALGPDEVIMLGDTPYDIEAAERARIGTIALRCGGWSDTDLTGAVAVYNDPADLLARYDSSPLAG